MSQRFKPLPVLPVLAGALNEGVPRDELLLAEALAAITVHNVRPIRGTRRIIKDGVECRCALGALDLARYGSAGSVTHFVTFEGASDVVNGNDVLPEQSVNYPSGEYYDLGAAYIGTLDAT